MNRTARLIVLIALLMSVGPSTAAAESWDRHGAPILTATQPWEKNAVQEPNVWRQDGLWHMIYTGGWERRALGYATATHPEGPWHKHGRILGQGFGGWNGVAAHSSIFRENGKLWVLFSVSFGDWDNAGQLRAAVGTNPYDLQTLPEPAMQGQGTALGIANTSLVKTGDHYTLAYESRVDDVAWWRTGIAVADNPAGPFTSVAFPLDDLARNPHGMYGGPNLQRARTGDWLLWYHASAQPGGLDTRLYRARSQDLVNWRVSGNRPQIGMRSWFEVDQVADPFRVQHGGRTFVFWDGMDNPGETGAITFGERR